MNDSECCICFESKKNKSQVITNCKHNFCLFCLLQHLNKSNDCPCCRKNILDEEKYNDLYKNTNVNNSVRNNLRTLLWNVNNFSPQNNNMLSHENIENNIQFNIENFVNSIIYDTLYE